MRTLKECEHVLREAVICGYFDDIRLAGEEYRRAFDREWCAMMLADRPRMALEGLQLMRWAIQQVKVLRGALAERRRATGAAGRYLATGRNRQMRTWGSAG
jgi:hypothetical protein